MKSRIYVGPSIENHETHSDVSPGVKYLFEKGLLKSPVVDWGCGKNVINANWLRAQG